VETVRTSPISITRVRVHNSRDSVLRSGTPRVRYVINGAHCSSRSKGFRTCLFVVICRGRDLLNADG
jgi:hypothetical protein